MTTRRWMTAALVAIALVAAGCGGGEEEDTTGGRVPESGIRQVTTTTEPEETTEETTTTVESEGPVVTEPPEFVALIEVEVTDGEAEVTTQAPGGRPTSEATIQVELDTPVQVRVTSDQPDQVLIRGYNRTAPVGPGAPATLQFVADQVGLFLIELQETHLPLARLDVGTQTSR